MSKLQGGFNVDVDGEFSEGELPMSDELSGYELSGEDDESSTKKWLEFNKESDMEKPEFSLGMLFPSTDVLVDAIMVYAVKAGK